MRIRRRLSGVAMVVLTAMLMAGALGSTAVAAQIPPLDIFPSERTVSMVASDGTSVTFTLRRAGGSLKQKETVLASEGRAEVQFLDPLKPGDRLTVKRGAATRTLTILRLTLAVPDRVTDLLSGKGTNGRTVRLTVHQCVLGTGLSTDCADALRRSVPVVRRQLSPRYHGQPEHPRLPGRGRAHALQCR